MEKKIKTVTFFPADKWGCGYYRCFLPAVSLCRQGIPAHLLTVDRTHLYELADTLILQRPVDPEIIGLIEIAQEKGKKVIYEVDDNLWGVPTWNQAYPFWTSVRLRNTEEILKHCDRAVVSTTALANVLKQFNDDVVVVPNAIFDSQYLSISEALHTDDKIVVGWIGSSFHLKDTEIFKKLIPKLLDTYPNIGFLMMGESPPKELNAYMDKIVTLPFIEPVFYHQVLNSFKIHIGLAPIVDNEFNECKSAVKILEYLYTNTYPVCSDVGPYTEFKKENPEVCTVIPATPENAGTVDDWMDVIGHCIKNIDDTEAKTKKGHDYIMETYNIETARMHKIYKEAYFLD